MPVRGAASRGRGGRSGAGALVAGALHLLLVLAVQLLLDGGLLLADLGLHLWTVSGTSVLMWFFTSTPSRRTICSTASLDMPRSRATS